MGKNRQSIGGINNGSRNVVDYTESNNAIYEEICKEKGLGKKGKANLKEVLNFCNENNLEMVKGKEYTTVKTDNPYYTYGDKARVSIIDRETGKTISIFNDAITGAGSKDITKESLDNLLKGLRYEMEHTNSDFNTLTSEIFITNHRLIKRNSSGRFIRSNNLAFYDPIVPNAITIQTEKVGKQALKVTGKIHSYDGGYDGSTVRGIAEVIAHENAHAYDYKKLGNGTHFGEYSVFSRWGKNMGKVGPTFYATTTRDETISTVCEQVLTRHLRSDAMLSDGTWVRYAYREKYGSLPNSPPTAKQEKEMYELWANDPEWKPLVREAERIMF